MMVLIHDVDPGCSSCIWAFKNATQLGFRDSVERADSLLRLPALTWREALSTLVEFARKLGTSAPNSCHRQDVLAHQAHNFCAIPLEFVQPNWTLLKSRPGSCQISFQSRRIAKPRPSIEVGHVGQVV
jgi:hypothetical protein